jgi:hypothetical protein
MSSRKSFISLVVVVALGAGAWLMLSGGIRQDENGPPQLSTVDSSKEESGITPSAPPVAGNVTTGYSASNPAETPRTEDAPRTQVAWPATALAFADKPDPDPALSRELKYWTQRSMAELLDKDRFELQSVECRGNSCQLLTVDRALSQEMGWGVVINEMFDQLKKDALVRHPRTGVLLQPEMQIVRPVPAGKNGAFITVIVFKDVTPAAD